MKTTTDHGPTWTSSGIAKLRNVLLEDALERLSKHRTPPQERAELMDWFGSDHLAPFSFVACAASCGLDHEELRAELLAVLSREDCVPEAYREAA
jgi:hypothetical protein